jgi:hypothetical protein
MHADTNAVWLVWNRAMPSAGTNNLIQPWTETGTTACSQRTTGIAGFARKKRPPTRRDSRATRGHRRRGARPAHAQRRRRKAARNAPRSCSKPASSGQRESLRTNGWFVVYTKSGRAFQIRRGRARNIIEVNTKRTYCCHPVDNVPDADSMLSQKLLLETDEHEFLRLANVS